MELTRCDPALAQVLKAVGWDSSAFRAYLSFAGGEEVNIRLILMSRREESSGEESQVDSASSSSISSTSESL